MQIMTARNSRHFRRDTVHFADREELDQAMIRDVSRVTWVGVWINIVLAVVKTVGGVLAGSQALLADAVHTLSDLATDAAILVGVRYWSAPADAEHPHGHQKIETLVTMAIGVLLALVGLGMGYESVASLARAAAAGQNAASAGPGGAAAGFSRFALGAALASIVGKELLYRWTAAKGVKLGSSALIANAWHHRSDALSSIPPLLSLAGMEIGRRYGYDLWFLDPVGTIVVCFMLLQAAWDVMRPTLGALVDSSADRKLCSAIRKTVLDTRGVIGAHRIRTRVICSHAVAVDLHVTVDMNLSVARGHAIATDVKNRLLTLEVPDVPMRAVDILVHVEPADPRDAAMPGAGQGGDTMVDWKVR